METAEQIRREWLALMGLDQDEIDDLCQSFPATDPDEEQIQLDAMRQILTQHTE